ncbi:unnamed protein product [Zymoseptoria tritici ST99CH_1A5]|uniref:DUF3824 domain-containing protein n=2 Tax=Zymoseptoria tritici TaxID=1047171 RepID=A0A2H1FNF8_ZYMTR|nr:unnamed protein product [Zymoseptoria tritici ST99CH_1E4]SMR44990.1 unnamed protein product [Zymoseptoria tritici ST99CH_3D1]SMY20154.1 unnamed protein product [Zymoseptoria tritici ST99CH_1A5]
MSTYSGYDDEPRRYRNVRVRPRERDEPDYVREETYIERGKGSGPRGAELVYRGRDDSIEDIPRDFPPPGRGNRRVDDYDAPRRSKSTGGRRYDDDDRYTDYGQSVASSRYDRRGGSRRDDRDYDSEYSRSPSPRRNRKSSNSGGIGDILKSIGAGGIVGGLLGNKDKGRDRSRSRSRGGRSARSRSRGARSRRDYSSSRSRSRGGNNNERKWAQAAQAALVAGAVEAFRSRKEPGPWTGEKGKRIATAALGAGGIDGLMQDRNPDEKSKRHLATAVLGGMAASRLANGSRANSRDREDRSEYSPERRPRSRSRSVIDRLRGRSKSRGRPASPDGGGGNGAVKGLLGAGAIAAAGKALYNKARSKSRKRRSPSNSSADSYRRYSPDRRSFRSGRSGRTGRSRSRSRY